MLLQYGDQWSWLIQTIICFSPAGGKKTYAVWQFFDLRKAMCQPVVPRGEERWRRSLNPATRIIIPELRRVIIGSIKLIVIYYQDLIKGHFTWVASNWVILYIKYFTYMFFYTGSRWKCWISNGQIRALRKWFNQCKASHDYWWIQLFCSEDWSMMSPHWCAGLTCSYRFFDVC